MEKVNLNNISKTINKIIREYAEENSDLERELFNVLDVVENEQVKLDEMKNFLSDLASKL